jgi:hypothetical protein
MFPLPIITWLKLGAALALAIFLWWSGYSFEASRFERYKAEQIAQVQRVEKEYQAATDEIRKKKNEKISNINSQLNDALVQLRSRPNRASGASDGQNRTGRSLFAEDAEFLEREAARADIIREGLAACYDQYDALRK